MATEKVKVVEVTEISIEEKLKALYELQKVDSDVDKIKILRGELPLEVQDLEDEIIGLETRMQNLEDELKTLDTAAANKKAEITNSQGLIKKYQEQQNNVRNNREFDSLSKEIELCEKRIREFAIQISAKNEQITQSRLQLEERQGDLKNKKDELEDISMETRKEEEHLHNKSKSLETIIEPRLITAYKRIRGNARNGLAVVTVERDACGGCFNKIPPQRQLDIKSRKKIIVCEYCGRILVDAEINSETTVV